MSKKLDRPDLIWSRCSADAQNRLKAFFLICSWTAIVIGFGLVMIYG